MSKNKYQGIASERDKFFLKVKQYVEMMGPAMNNVLVENQDLLSEELKDKKNFEAFSFAAGSLIPLGMLSSMRNPERGEDLFNLALNQLLYLREHLDDFVFWVEKNNFNTKDDEKEVKKG